MGLVSQQIRLVIKTIEYAGVLTRKTAQLRPWLPRNPFLRNQKPRHLRPHVGKGNAILECHVFGSFNLVVCEDKVWSISINYSLKALIGLWPEGVEEFLALDEVSPPTLSRVVPATISQVELIILSCGDCAANYVDSRNEWVRVHQPLTSLQRRKLYGVASRGQDFAYLQYRRCTQNFWAHAKVTIAERRAIECLPEFVDPPTVTTTNILRLGWTSLPNDIFLVV